jgi:hypothetical protein
VRHIGEVVFVVVIRVEIYWLKHPISYKSFFDYVLVRSAY